MAQWRVFLILMGFYAFMVHTVQCQSCETELCGSQVKFWIATTKNQNNEWIAETGLEHPKKKNGPGWKLQVEGDSVDCAGDAFCRLVATISPLCNQGNNSKSDFRSFGIGRYKFHNELATWDEAKKICESENSHLAVVDSLAEVALVKELVAGSKNAYSFVGFTDRVKEGIHVDIFGKPVLMFWAKHQPDNAGKNENCGTVTKDGTLNDYPCTTKTSFICEIPY